MQWKPIKELDFNKFKNGDIFLLKLNPDSINFDYFTNGTCLARLFHYIQDNRFVLVVLADYNFDPTLELSEISYFMKLEQPEGEQP